MSIAHHITNEDTTVSQCLAKHFRMDATQAQELIDLGAIYSNKKRVFEDRKLPKGTYLRLHLRPKRFDISGIDWAKTIVHDGPDYIVVNKPTGLPVHASLDNNQENVLFQLRKHTGYPLFVTQRLDIPVGGALVFAKNPDYQRRFNNWLMERKVHKVYRALTQGTPPTGLQVHFMEPSERSPRRVKAEETKGWARCELTILEAKPVAQGTDCSLVLHTGRTHQIRAQLSALGCPILGDRMYGSRERYLPGQIALFSSRLEIPSIKGPKAVFELSPAWATAPNPDQNPN